MKCNDVLYRVSGENTFGRNFKECADMKTIVSLAIVIKLTVIWCGSYQRNYWLLYWHATKHRVSYKGRSGPNLSLSAMRVQM